MIGMKTKAGIVIILVWFAGLLGYTVGAGQLSGFVSKDAAAAPAAPAPRVELLILKDGSNLAGEIVEDTPALLKLRHAVVLRPKAAPEGEKTKPGEMELVVLSQSEVKFTGEVTVARDMVALREVLAPDSPLVKSVLGQ